MGKHDNAHLVIQLFSFIVRVTIRHLCCLLSLSQPKQTSLVSSFKNNEKGIACTGIFDWCSAATNHLFSKSTMTTLLRLLAVVVLLGITTGQGEWSDVSEIVGNNELNADETTASVPKKMKGQKKKKKGQIPQKNSESLSPPVQMSEKERKNRELYEHHPDSKEDRLLRATKAGDLEEVRCSLIWL
jgi:hypothetical protein